MSDKLTEIHVRHASIFKGLADRGEKTHAEMVSWVRRYAEECRAIADEIDGCEDEQFEVRLVRGIHRKTVLRDILPDQS